MDAALIGSHHWAYTRLTHVKNVGWYMKNHPDLSVELQWKWGESLHAAAQQLIDGYPKIIYLIEKIWVDPMDNHNAVGYAPHTFRFTAFEAKLFCEKGRMYTQADCWAIMLGDMPEFRYKSIPLL